MNGFEQGDVSIGTNPIVDDGCVALPRVVHHTNNNEEMIEIQINQQQPIKEGTKPSLFNRTNSNNLLSPPTESLPMNGKGIPKTKSPSSLLHFDSPNIFITNNNTTTEENFSTIPTLLEENPSPKRSEKPSPIIVPNNTIFDVSETPRNLKSSHPSNSIHSDPPLSTRNSIILTPTNSKFISQANIPLEVEDSNDNSNILSTVSFFQFLNLIMGKNPNPKLREAQRLISQHNVYSITKWFKWLTLYFAILFVAMHQICASQTSILVFFGLFPIEIANNMICNYVTCCKARSVVEKSSIHMIRAVVISILAFTWQYYYYDLPFYLISMIKQIIACHVFGEEIIISSVASIIISTGTIYPLYILNIGNRKLVEVIFLMISATLISLFFAYIYAEEKRNHYKQKFAYIQEKYMSNEKTHMIANISHEARNPLHGILGASTILRHDMEKNSHSDKKKKRGRKNSFLQSPSHSPLQSKNNFLNVSNDDAHYSSDCDSYCGDSTCEQPYLELVNDIYNNANLLLHIFSTSLQMTSLEMGNIKLKNEPFNLLDTIESVISVFYNIAADKNVSLHSYINLNSLPNQVMGDHVRVSQILMNFISNSIKYSSSDSKESSVVIRCDICNDEELKSLNVEKDKIIEMLEDKEDIIFVKIDCIDNGKGIERDNISSLFKAFQIFDLKNSDSIMDSSGTVFDQYYLKSISGNTKGSNGTSLLLSNRTGVGLNISKQLVERMKGCIMVSSELGIGTTMSVIFPFKKKVDSPTNEFIIQSVKNHLSLENSLESFNVILIDKENLFLNLLEDYLYLLNPNINVEKYRDTTGIKDISTSKPNIVIYSESLHYEVKYLFKQSTFDKILIPIGHRGKMRRFSNMKYIIKPLKVDEMIAVLNEKIEKHKKRAFTEILPEIKVSTENHHTRSEHEDSQIVEPKVEPETESSRRVLITDDNLINRKVMEKMVRLLGFTQVDCASNGLECFEMYKQKSYSIILLDLLMPVMCGKQSLKHIREFEESEGKKRTPVIAITANIWESPDTLSQLGFDSVIYKPILIEKLKEEIDRLTSSQ